MKLTHLCLFLVLSLLAFPCHAADLAWDYDEYHDLSAGYTVYFSAGEADYNYTFGAEEVVVEEDTVKWGPIEDVLNLQPGTEYTFALTRYNDVTESGQSNTVNYTRPTHSPPADSLPPPVLSPQDAGGLRIE